MTQSLSQSLGQYMRLEQKLTPQLIQSMSILQLNTLALENRVAEELEKNFALEMVEPTAEPSTEGMPDTRADTNGEADSFDRLDRLNQEYGADAFVDAPYRGNRAAPQGDRDAKMDAMANAASRPASLTEHLLAQWATIDLDEDTRSAGEAIIFSLEDDGYLKTRLEDLAADHRPPLSVEVVRDALLRVQQLDPIGIAARDIQECLLLQIEALPGDNAIERKLVRDHLQDLIRNRYPAIAKKTGYSVGEITEAVAAMRSTLVLHPGYKVVDTPAPRVTPDAIIDYADSNGRLEARLTRGNNPRLRVSRQAAQMLKDRGSDKKVRDFVRQHVESASALMDAIKFRRERLVAVLELVIERQSEFFDVGPEGLKILRMSDLATELECDPSTISRTVAGKYVQTPRGIYPVRYFFTGGTETAAGESTSWDSVKLAVQKLIEKEDKANPLNDDQVAETLKEQGIGLSRRTVAKYRQQLGIPSSRQRRVFD